MDWLVKSKPKAKLEGNYKFHININTEQVDSSTTLNITAFTDQSQRAVVPCHYAWLIIKNGVPQQVQEFKGSSFICETAHIGYLVQAHIVSNDADYPGKAIVTLGPVELDVTLKTDILSSLSQGYSSQPVYLISSELEERQCNIQVFEDKMKISHAFSDLSYIFDYSLMEPLFTHHPKEVNNLSILFNQKYQSELKKFQRRLFNRDQRSLTQSRSFIKQQTNSSSSNQQLKLDLRFLCRAHRDIFLYTIKGFITKRELKNSAAIRKIQKINFQNSEQFSSILLVNELRKDLVRYDRAYKKLASDKKKLEEQGISSTMNLSVMKREDPLANRVVQLDRENQMLTNRCRQLAQEVNNLKMMTPPPPPPTPPPPTTATNFKKKREPEENTITYLLDDLNRSEQVVHFDAEQHFTIERLQSQKRVLQMNLDQANDKIAYLQKRGNSLPHGSIPIDRQLYDRIKTENDELKRLNDKQERDIKQATTLIQQLKFTPKQPSPSRGNEAYLQRQLEDVKSRLAICQQQLQEATKSKDKYQQKCLAMSRKVADLQTQNDMFRRNQDVMNRSQSLSEQMDDYNEQQIRILKEHNTFLVSENQKLAKACQKYMAEAKQAIKLRQEILQLKQKLSKAYTNPENQSYTN